LLDDRFGRERNDLLVIRMNYRRSQHLMMVSNLACLAVLSAIPGEVAVSGACGGM